MKSEKLKQIEEIYHSALEIPPNKRAAFLQKACRKDEVLLREVNSLLTFESNSENFLNMLPESLVAEMFAEENVQTNLINTEIGHYKIIRLLGKGGMGEVYLAEDTKLDRKVALKILPPEFASEEMRMSRFIREAKSASALNHPNIITIYEIGEVENIHFIATEFINGKTLNEYAKNTPLNFYSALEIAVQIASALDEAHSAGIIHRDIKPDNVMIRTNGLVKILDFGIAKPTRSGNEDSDFENQKEIRQNSPNNHRFTHLGTIIGTVDYMSPEQSKGKEVDARTDIFSFGVVLYEMMAGHLPFESEKLVGKSVASNYETKSLNAELPVELTKIIDKCLKINRDERYQTIKEVLRDLEEIRKELTFGETNQRTVYATEEIRTNKQTLGISPTDEHVSVRSPLNKWLIAAFAVLLITVSLYFGYQFFTSNKQIKSIAVMPFVIDSDNKEMEYLSDGVTEMLISRLSSIPNLSIKARNTVFTYKGKEILPYQIGLELKVDAVLFGKFIQRGDEIKLDLELVETATQNILWAKNYDRRMKDLVSLQSQIAGDVSEKLQMKTTEEERKQVEKIYTTSSEAHQLYLKGRFHWNKRDVRDFELAIEYFKQALEKDPDYALAYAGLADTYVLMPLYGNFRPKEYMPLAKQSALKALELDKNLAQAHASLGRILNSFDFDWEGGEREFIRSIKLNPNYPTVHQWYAELLAFKGKPDEALGEISKALELDPLSLTINRMKGNILSFAGSHNEAIVQLNKTAELYPENALVRYNLGDVFAAKEMPAESIEQYLIAFKLDRQTDAKIQNFKVAFLNNGWKGFWSEHLKNQLEESLENDNNAYLKNEGLAFAYAAVKNKKKALEYLNKAFEERDPLLITINNSKVYDFLADDPRFKELLKKIGLPE